MGRRRLLVRVGARLVRIRVGIGIGLWACPVLFRWVGKEAREEDRAVGEDEEALEGGEHVDPEPERRRVEQVDGGGGGERRLQYKHLDGHAERDAHDRVVDQAPKRVQPVDVGVRQEREQQRDHEQRREQRVRRRASKRRAEPRRELVLADKEKGKHQQHQNGRQHRALPRRPDDGEDDAADERGRDDVLGVGDLGRRGHERVVPDDERETQLDAQHAPRRQVRPARPRAPEVEGQGGDAHRPQGMVAIVQHHHSSFLNLAPAVHLASA